MSLVPTEVGDNTKGVAETMHRSRSIKMSTGKIDV